MNRYDKIVRIIVGGSHPEAKIVHWNCRTLRNGMKNDLAKMHLLNNLKAIIISLNETNGQLKKSKTHNIFEELPAVTKRPGQLKYNAALMVDHRLKTIEVKRKVNYVSVVVSNLSLIGSEILVASAYCRPQEAIINQWQETLLDFDEDVKNAARLYGVKRFVLLGDLNVERKILQNRLS